jgi:hypothetical protein
LTGSSAGTFTGQISFDTNDADETPFNFTVTGVVGTAPLVQIVDDNDAAFVTAPPGAWFLFTGQGFQSDVTFASPGTGSATASWRFTGLTAGLYRVSATWSPHPNRATNAPYTVLDGITPIGAAAVNQQLRPNHVIASGAAWYHLGVFNVASGSLDVLLSDDANGYVIADAVRVEYLGASPVQVQDDGDLGFTSTDGFFSSAGQGQGGDVQFAAAGDGSEQATWTFTALPAGVYRVSVTWSAHANRATDAPFTVLDDTTALATFLVNQEQAPDDFAENGTDWQDLGAGLYYVSSGTLVVQLTNLADEYVIADAVRIERVA